MNADTVSDTWWIDGAAYGSDAVAAELDLRSLVSMSSGLVPVFVTPASGPILDISVALLVEAVEPLGGPRLDPAEARERLDVVSSDFPDSALFEIAAIETEIVSGYPSLRAPMVEAWPYDSESLSDVWLVGDSPWPRTVGPSAGISLAGDAEIAAGRRYAGEMSWHDVVWWNGEGHLVGVGGASLIAQHGERLTTPPAADGAIESGWRRYLNDVLAVDETSIDRGSWTSADALAAVTRSGSVVGISFTDGSAEGIAAGPLVSLCRQALSEAA